MNYLKQNHLSILIIVFLVGSYFLGGSGVKVGALDLTTVGNPWKFTNTVLHNGAVTENAGVLNSYPSATTTMSSTETLVLADVAGYDVVILNPNVAGNTALTLFASSTATTWLPTAGDRQRTCFVNGTTTAGAYYTFAGGTGSTLIVASSSATALGGKTIYPQKMGCFDFVRGNTTATTFDILGALEVFQ